MAENNIDPEVQRQINEHFETMSRILPGLNKSTKDMTEAEIAQAAAAKATAQALANYNSALNSGSNALKSFALTMTTTTTEFSRFGGVLKDSGDAVMSLGKNFGALGTVVGMLFKGATMLAQLQLKQADNVLKASDELSKMGVAGGMTTGALLDMAHKAGYSSESLASYTKATKSLGTDIIGLGGNVKQGVKAFGELTNVGDSVYESFQRLGVSQAELTQNQADYIKLQVSSGKQITEQMKRDGSLKAASLEYTKNLLELSAISGIGIEQAKKVKEQATANFDIGIKTRELDDEKNRLLASNIEGDKEKAAQIQKEIDANAKMLEVAVLTGDAQFIAATQSRIATGAWTDVSMVLRNTVPEFEKLQKGLQDGTVSQAEFAEAVAKGSKQQREQLGTSMKFSKDLADERGNSLQMQQFSTKILGKGFAAAAKESKDEIDAAAAGKGTGAGTDNSQLERNKLTTLTRDAAVELDKLLAKTNFLLSGWNALTIATAALTVAAVAAAAALGAIAFGKGAKALLGSGGGGAGAIAEGAGSLLGGAGGDSSKSTGRTRDAKGRYTKMPAGVSGNIEKLGGITSMADKAGGGATGGFLSGIANGLKAFANPQVLLGAAGFGISIAAIGAGIAGATWLVGKALPTLAEGMKAFETLDGKKLQESGKGIGYLGAGLAVFGAGGAAAGIGSILGNLSDGIVNFFGGKTPIDKLVEFSNLNINGKKVKENAEAFIAFGEAMAKSSIGSASIGNLVNAIADGIGIFFSGKTPIDKFVEFSKLNIDGKKVKENSDAFVVFNKSMSESSSSKGIIGEISESISTFFKINPPFDKLVEFSNLNINGKKVKENADAFVAFGEAMSESSSSKGIIGEISESISTFFKINPPFDKLVEFSNLNINGKKVKENADAFVAFGEAMAKSSIGSASIGNLMGNIADGISTFFSGKTPIDKVVEFSKLNIDGKKVKENADAFAIFGKAMNNGSSNKGIIGEIAESIAIFFKVQPPFDKLVEFSNLNINKKKTKENADAFAIFGKAMSKSGSNKGIIGEISESISTFFKINPPFDKLVEFSNLNINEKKVKENADAFAVFSKAMNNGSSNKGIIGEIAESIAIFFKVQPPFDKLVEFSKLNINGEKVKENADAFVVFSKAMGEYKGGPTGGIVGEIAESIAIFFKVQPPFDKLVEFSKLNINGEKVKENADAFVVFSKAMGEYKGGPTGGIVGEIAESISTFFKINPPFNKFIEFSNLNINGEKVKENADAFVVFSKAMGEYKGGPTGGIVGEIAESISTFFKINPPFNKFIEFSNLNIDGKKTKENADAFVVFSKSMSEYKGGPTGGIVGEIAESISTFFKINPPLNKFVEFSKLDIADPDKVKKNATAFAAFGSAMATSGLGSVSSGLGNLVGGVADAVGKLFGNKDAIQKFVDFTKLNVDPEKAGKLAEAFKAYTQGMSSLGGTVSSKSSVGAAAPVAAVEAAPVTAKSATAGAAGGASAVAPVTAKSATTSAAGGSSSTSGTGGAITEDSVKAAKVSTASMSELLKFTSGTGSENNFKELDNDIQRRILAAAEDYKSITGKLLQVNSAKRDPADQQRLYDETIKLGTPGIGPNGMAVSKPGKSRHERGQAVDIQQGKGDDKAISALSKQGLVQGVPGDPVHFQLPQLENGAVTNGASVAMIGEGKRPEVLAPFDPNSLLAKMLLAPASDTIAQTSAVNDNNTMDNSILVDLMQMISDKLDDVITALESGNDTSEEILQYSQA